MKPFLKWAGGKSKLVPRIAELLPPSGRLVEPFLGSGAVYMGLPDYGGYLLADANPDLTDLYGILRDGGRGFVEEVRRLFVPGNNVRAAYNALREEFNATPQGTARRAALFVYLNRHCFNGLCRYNAAGGFNVPFGSQAQPYFPEREMLDFAARAVARRAVFRHADFRAVMAEAGEGDVVYCDPPYVPLSATASFDSYAKGGFSPKDHRDLADACRAAAARGATVVLSNHDTPEARALYMGAEFRAIEVRRSVSGNANRGKAAEVLVRFSRGDQPVPANLNGTGARAA